MTWAMSKEVELNWKKPAIIMLLLKHWILTRNLIGPYQLQVYLKVSTGGLISSKGDLIRLLLAWLGLSMARIHVGLSSGFRESHVMTSWNSLNRSFRAFLRRVVHIEHSKVKLNPVHNVCIIYTYNNFLRHLPTMSRTDHAEYERSETIRNTSWPFLVLTKPGNISTRTA